MGDIACACRIPRPKYFQRGEVPTTEPLRPFHSLLKKSTSQYLHFSSCHPRSVFKELVKGEAIRFLRSNTHAPTFRRIKNKFRTHLILRGYPTKFVDPILQDITHNLRCKYLPTSNTAYPPDPSLSPSPSPRTPSNPRLNPRTSPNPNLRLITTYSPYYKDFREF